MRLLWALLLVVVLAAAGVAGAPVAAAAEESLHPVEGSLGTRLYESIGRWYILEVWSNITTIDFGEECIFFEVESDPDHKGGICLTKTDVFKNGTRQRYPMCLEYDYTNDNWVKPGERRLSVVAAPTGFLVLDAPITLDHWVLVLGRRRRQDHSDTGNIASDRNASGRSDADSLSQSAADPVRVLARRLRLGSPASSVRLPNPYPNNCDYLQN